MKKKKKRLMIALSNALLVIVGGTITYFQMKPKTLSQNYSAQAVREKIGALKKESAFGKQIQVEQEDKGFMVPMAPNETTFVGYGINLINSVSFADAITTPIFPDEFYVKATSTASPIDSIVLNSIEGNTSVGDTLNEAFNSLEVSAEVRTGSAVPFFSGGIKTKFGSKQEVKSESKFYNAIYSVTTKKQTLKAIYQSASGLKKISDPELLDFINDKTVPPSELFDALGTHIIISSSIGGSINISALYNSDEKISSSDLSVALDFKSSYVGGGASTALSDSQKKIATQTKVTISGRGGEAGLLAGVSFADIGGAINKWGATVQTSPQTIANIYKTIPVWKLAPTTTRQKELEDYFYSKADEMNRELLGYFTKSAAPSMKQPLIVDGGKYVFLNFKSYKAIDVKGMSKENDAMLHLWDEIANHSTQQWKAVESKSSPGYFNFLNASSNKTIQVTYGTADRSQIRQYTFTGRAEHLFKIRENSNGTISFISQAAENKVVGVGDTPHDNGKPIILMQDKANYCDMWFVKRID